MFSIRVQGKMPAFCTRMSSRPWRSSAAETARSASALQAMSAWTQPRRRCRAGRFVTIGDDDLGALLDEALGDRLADAACGTDDERDAVLQSHASFCRIWSFRVSMRTAASTSAPRIIWV